MSDNLPAPQMQDFWGNMDSKDFAIPMVSIGQPTSQNGETGKFNYNNGAAKSKIEGCKLIVPHKTRVLYAGLGKGSRCSSDNFYTPAARIADPISTSCMNCYASEWGDDDPKKARLHQELGAKRALRLPMCQETYNLLMADGDFNPFFIKFQSSMLKEVQEKLFSRLRFEFGGVPPYGVAFDMSLDEIKNNKGRYFNVRFENFRKLSDDETAKASAMYSQHSKSAQNVLAKQHQEMDEARASAPSNDGWPPVETDVTPNFSTDEELPF